MSFVTASNGKWFALAAAMAIATPAASQDMQTGHIIRQREPATIEKEGVSRGDLARRTVVAFAQCTLTRHRKDVLAWLADPDNKKALDRVIDDNCLFDGELSFSHLIIRGALYTALYRDEFARRPVPLKLAPLDVSQVPAASDDPTIQSFGTLLTFADCVVRRDADAARTLILAAPGSQRDKDASAALSVHYPKCLVQGTQLKFSKTILVGLISEALYRESQGQGAGTQEAAK